MEPWDSSQDRVLTLSLELATLGLPAPHLLHQKARPIDAEEVEGFAALLVLQHLGGPRETPAHTRVTQLAIHVGHPAVLVVAGPEHIVAQVTVLRGPRLRQPAGLVVRVRRGFRELVHQDAHCVIQRAVWGDLCVRGSAQNVLAGVWVDERGAESGQGGLLNDGHVELLGKVESASTRNPTHRDVVGGEEDEEVAECSRVRDIQNLRS